MTSPPPVEDTAAPVASRISAPVDPVALAQLWADHFQHLTTVGVAGAGGILILIQAKLFASGERWWLALALFVATATLSMYGQTAVVDDASEGKLPGKKPRVIRALAFASLGAAAGAAVATVRL